MFPLSKESGHLLRGQVDELDPEERGVDQEVPALVVRQVVVLDAGVPRDLLLHGHLLPELHGRQDLAHLNSGIQ